MEQFAIFDGFSWYCRCFKIRLDIFWLDQETKYNWEADIRIGSRCQVNIILDR